MTELLPSPPKKTKSANSVADKLTRKNLQEQQRRMKPGECHKYVKVLIDPECIKIGPLIPKHLTELSYKFEIEKQKVSQTILWQRQEQQNIVQNEQLISITDKFNLEEHLLYLIKGEELVQAVHHKTLTNCIKEIRENYKNIKITILIYGLKAYCKVNPDAIKRKEVEMALTELQIVDNCCHRILETAENLAATVAQFTKAIAEIPFKKQEQEKFSDVNLYLSNDNKDCVRVDGTAGLSRLWQQHLTRLPLVTLETTEAIINRYSKPSLLFEAYNNSINGADILADLKIRRAGGPCTAERRVGTELSRKIHTLYTSLNPDEVL